MTSPPSTAGSSTADLFRDRPGWEGADDDVFGGGGRGRSSSSLRAVIEWLAVVVGALVAALLIKTFLFQAFYIPSGSMEPTLQIGDRVLVNKLSYDIGDIEQGDIVVFHRPESLPVSDIDEFIKRVIALPGETVESIDGRVFVDDEPVEEGYLPEGTITTGLPRQTVPEGFVFVMGDNRGDSTDSRVFGPIPVDDIVGQAFVRVWPLPDVGGL